MNTQLPAVQRYALPESLWTQVKNDVNGNPRHVIHFCNLLTDVERLDYVMSLSQRYDLAVERAKQFGGMRYRGKDYSGGIVFQRYNRDEHLDSRLTARLVHDDAAQRNKALIMHVRYCTTHDPRHKTVAGLSWSDNATGLTMLEYLEAREGVPLLELEFTARRVYPDEDITDQINALNKLPRPCNRPRL